jgi:hypothetical protein
VRELAVELPLTGLAPVEVRSREPLDLAALPGTTVLTLIRHRY